MKEAIGSKKVRSAVTEDLSDIRRIYDSAKIFMENSGNTKQWYRGYPPKEVLTDDIACGRLFVICTEDDNTPHAVFALIPGADPTYAVIEDGEWQSDNPYAAIHRVASDGVLRRVVESAVSFSAERYPELEIRIDTHEDNIPMQTALHRLGFVKCGIIHLANGDPRLAYQLLKI